MPRLLDKSRYDESQTRGPGFARPSRRGRGGRVVTECERCYAVIPEDEAPMGLCLTCGPDHDRTPMVGWLNTP